MFDIFIWLNFLQRFVIVVLLYYLWFHVSLRHSLELISAGPRCIITPTCWNFVSLAPDPPQTLLLCRASCCPRWGKPSVYPGTDTSTGCEGSVRCYHQQWGSSPDHRSPCPPIPMSTERGSPAQTAAWRQPHGRSFYAPSPDEDERYPPAWSFHLWWILWEIFRSFYLSQSVQIQCSFWSQLTEYKAFLHCYSLMTRNVWRHLFYYINKLMMSCSICSKEERHKREINLRYCKNI